MTSSRRRIVTALADQSLSSSFNGQDISFLIQVLDYGADSILGGTMENKRCCTCRQAYPATEFNWKNKARGELSAQCKSCRRSSRKAWYNKHRSTHIDIVRRRKQLRKQELQELVWNHLSNNPCVDCGEKDPVVLEFDHTSGRKRFNISHAIHDGRAINSVQDEIRKCEVRCANCHRRITARRSNTSKHRRSIGVTDNITRS